MTKIGKVYANTEREEDRADAHFIAQGWIAGEGLLGAVVKAVDKLEGVIFQQGWYSDSPQLLKTIEDVRREYFNALKAIEDHVAPLT